MGQELILWVDVLVKFGRASDVWAIVEIIVSFSHGEAIDSYMLVLLD